jgi:nucleoside-diphosphate-sugar epimerase
MDLMPNDANDFIIKHNDVILVTGAAGFIGVKVVENLLDRGFTNVRCFVRKSIKASRLARMRGQDGGSAVQMFEGNLLFQADCVEATRDATVVIHLAAGRGEKSFPDAFMNSVVTTRNLLEACVRQQSLRRFVNISSFAVYSNINNRSGNLLDETSPVERRPDARGEAYTFAKAKQEELVAEYGRQFGMPVVHVRPGAVYGPENPAITGRVGIGTFGLFLHLGGSNRIPLTYVDNCADAIVLAALKTGVNGEVFNVVDDDLPTSRQFLQLYKREVKRFPSLYLPKFASYSLCYLWEQYSKWSEGQLPAAFNRSRWNSFWKSTKYSNLKLKAKLGWNPTVSTKEGMRLYMEACRVGGVRA